MHPAWPTVAGALLWVLGVMSARAEAPRDLEQACTAAVELSLPDTHIISAEPIRAQSPYVVPVATASTGDPRAAGPLLVTDAFCRVVGVIDADIHFEVWLPLAHWNGRFEGLGVGAFLGALPYAQMVEALRNGYAVGGTDTGHQSAATDASWAMTAHALDTISVENWAHRGIHEMSVQAQAIVSAVYGRRADHSYFVGCSSGGSQALSEAQRYPGDYDGVLAGAPANDWTHLMAGQLWYGQATRLDPASDLEAPIDKLLLIHRAALEACDARDGVRDGVIEDPLSCRFDPGALACKATERADCLTAPQLLALRRIYGAAHGADGRSIFPGLAPGSELGWPLMSRLQVAFAQTFYRVFVFQDNGWNFSSLDFDHDVAMADRTVGPLVNSIDPDLQVFRARGSKLLQYHGWSDPLISPYSSIEYYESVLARFGAMRRREQALRDVQGFDRLFMVPGMTHCRGGEGTDHFDGLAALQRWVERGEAPDRLEAARVVDGAAIRTRPLCPYPRVARYRGHGSTDVAANFLCASPPRGAARSRGL
jgi:feruloyl esterase